MAHADQAALRNADADEQRRLRYGFNVDRLASCMYGTRKMKRQRHAAGAQEHRGTGCDPVDSPQRREAQGPDTRRSAAASATVRVRVGGPSLTPRDKVSHAKPILFSDRCVPPEAERGTGADYDCPFIGSSHVPLCFRGDVDGEAMTCTSEAPYNDELPRCRQRRRSWG